MKVETDGRRKTAIYRPAAPGFPDLVVTIEGDAVSNAIVARSSVKEDTTRRSVLPISLPPRGLSRGQAAEYIGVSATKFDQLVKDGRMPVPKCIDGRRVWDRIKVDVAFSALPGDEP